MLKKKGIKENLESMCEQQYTDHASFEIKKRWKER